MVPLPRRLPPTSTRTTGLLRRGLAGWALAGSLLMGCAGEEPSTPSELPLRVVTFSDPLSLDPHLANEHLTSSVLGNTYDTLVRFDPSLRIEPSLAQRWDNPDARTWRFHLRPGVLFHDGSPLDAQDVVYSLERARTHPDSQVTAYLVAVDEIRLLDASTVEVTTAEPVATLLNKLAFLAIVPEGSSTRIESPVGSGPYRFVEHVPGESVAFEAWDRYWGPAPSERRFEILVEEDRGRRVQLMLNGEAELLHGLRPADAERMRASPGLRIVAAESLVVEFLELNILEPPLDDPRVRAAIDLSLDRSALVEQMFAGQGVPMAQLVTQNVVGHLPDRLPRERDLAEARRLLAEAGHPDGLELELELEAESTRVLEPIFEQLAEAGIRIRVVRQPRAELYERLLAGDVRFHLGAAYAESADASDLFDEILHSRDPERGYGASNAVRYSNPIVDALIERSGTTLDTLERREILQECHRLVLEDRVLIPLFVRKELYAMSDHLDWTPRMDALLLAAEMKRL